MYRFERLSLLSLYLVLLTLPITLPFISRAESSTSGSEVPVSAVRGAMQSWQEALSNANLKWNTHEDLSEPSLIVLNQIRVDSSLDISGLPEWTHGLAALNSLTSQAWTSRRYANPNRGDFLRRAAWLFPVDGCYAKAAHVSAEAVRSGYPKPGKIFAYGNLEYATKYARNRKKTYWSYHVAAGYRMGNQIYILDPMISPQGVLKLSSWLSQISPKPSSVKVKICDSNAYSPHSKCRGSRGNGAYTGHMRGVLVNEWNHLINIGYDPLALLGSGSPLMP